MAQVISIPLPAFINPDFINERISENLAKSLKDRQANIRKFPEHVKEAMPTVVRHQVLALLRRDQGVLWDLASPQVNITELPEGYEGRELYDITEDNVAEIGRYLVEEILDAIDTSCRLVGGAAGALASQNFPTTDDLTRPL